MGGLAESELIAELEERLRRYPAEQYPVQHATARFHLGVVLTDNGRIDDARDALDVAVRLFDPGALPVEHAKATNALGVALRLAGRPQEAAAAFERAAAAFRDAALEAEEGAALYNLGLVSGDAECLRRARELLLDAGQPVRAGAAARELGAALLAVGDLDGAQSALEEAIGLAERAADQAGLAAADNALGLVELAGGHPAEAIARFRAAAGGHPRSVRPDGYAMAKANLAVACERAGDAPRARLAARQALGTAGAPEAVRAQAAAVLDRLGGGPGAVLDVLDAEPSDHWPPILRDELTRWADADPAERRAEAAAWVEGQLARDGADLAEVWLGAALELPPPQMETLVRGLLEAVRSDPDAGERFRSQTSMAMGRFHVPQWTRLKDTFARIATELDVPGTWG